MFGGRPFLVVGRCGRKEDGGGWCKAVESEANDGKVGRCCCGLMEVPSGAIGGRWAVEVAVEDEEDEEEADRVVITVKEELEELAVATEFVFDRSGRESRLEVDGGRGLETEFWRDKFACKDIGGAGAGLGGAGSASELDTELCWRGLLMKARSSKVEDWEIRTGDDMKRVKEPVRW